MDHRWLISAVLLTGAVLACACGSGEVSGAGTPSEEPSGDPRIQDEVEIGEPTVDAGVQESTKPTAANTGCNASPYPSEDCDDIPGVPDTDCSDITEAYVTANCPGRICSNFYCKGGVIDIDTSNVTLRNFKHDADGSLYAIRINEGVSNTVIEYGEVWNGDSTVVYDKSNNLLFRYNYLHHSESDFIKADGTNGIYEYNFWEKGGSGEGTHADGVQTEPSSDNNEFRYNNCSMPKPGTPLHDAYPQDTNPPYFSPGPPYRSNACFIIQGSNTWIHHNWLTGGNYTIYGNTTTLVEYNIFGRENGDHPSRDDTCTLCTGRARLCNGPFQDWRGNIWEDNGLSAGEGEEDGGTPCD
jgi:hypothetical protein